MYPDRKTLKALITRARNRAAYAPGSVRAWRWHGRSDVRGYVPETGWTAKADLSDVNPITGESLPQSIWWIVETKRCSSAPSSSSLDPRPAATAGRFHFSALRRHPNSSGISARHRKASSHPFVGKPPADNRASSAR